MDLAACLTGEMKSLHPAAVTRVLDTECLGDPDARASLRSASLTDAESSSVVSLPALFENNLIFHVFLLLQGASGPNKVFAQVATDRSTDWLIN